MKKRALSMITIFMISFLLFSCSSGYTEERTGAESLDELAYFPIITEGMELLFDGVVDGETVMEIKSDVSFRFNYESRLDYLWYKYVETEPEMEDRLTTYIHPTGWRAAIYDNRRNKELAEKYGDDDYVWQVRICKIRLPEGFFPEYPESGRVLFFDEKFTEEYEAFPRDVLPDDFPDLPECSQLTNAERNECGLAVSFITTYDDFEKYYKNVVKTYEPSGGCCADENHNYFYLTIEGIKVIEHSEESSEEISYPDDIREAMEKSRHEYYIEELPIHYDESGEPIEPDVNSYCKITIYFVKAEWIPEWWVFKEEK